MVNGLTFVFFSAMILPLFVPAFCSTSQGSGLSSFRVAPPICGLTRFEAIKNRFAALLKSSCHSALAAARSASAPYHCGDQRVAPPMTVSLSCGFRSFHLQFAG